MNRHTRHKLFREVDAYLAFCVTADYHPVEGFTKFRPLHMTGVVKRITDYTRYR